MIFGIGIDQVEVARVEKRLAQESGLKESLFTPGEIAYCQTKRYGAQNFAARFAAKEAFLKALGTGWREGIAFREIEIINDQLGKPSCRLHGQASKMAEQNHIIAVQVSLTHIHELAAAIVTLET
ncbi:MAG: holo-ACP synthase [candidate division Zixibacteria bacterium]|nr:holo-ACP synthase [candidate division Zixibacteria bacterium]